MILVSFFSQDNALSDETKICYIFEYQSNENQAFPLFWGTPGVDLSIIRLFILLPIYTFIHLDRSIQLFRKNFVIFFFFSDSGLKVSAHTKEVLL